jgi:hypothetical protein
MKSSHLGVAALVLAIGGLWVAAGGTRPPAAQAGEQLRVAAPVAHENLAVYFVHGPDAIDDSRVVGLQEAIDNKWVVVHETGEVSELAIENISADRDVFIQSGDMIKGGRQDRMIASDMLVRPKSGKLPLPSHCVEQGRWSGRGKEAATHFSKSDNFAVGNAIKLANANRDQSGVWLEVASNQTKLAAKVGTPVADPQSPTSLQLTLENPAVQAKVADFERCLLASGQNRAGVVGAVFVVNGKVTAAEVYGSSGLFQKAWPKLLRAASAEAVAERKPGDPPAAPNCREVELFLASAAVADPVGQARGEADLAEGEWNRTRVNRGWVNLGGVANNLDNTGAQQILERVVNDLNRTEVQVNLNPALPQLQARGGRSPEPSPQPAARQPANPSANPLATNRVDNRGSVMLESRDSSSGNAVIHRSYLKK